jgi:hypothetical protein
MGANNMSSETTLELQKLREEVAALQDARRAQDTEQSEAAISSSGPADTSSSDSTTESAAEQAGPEAVDKSQLEELAELLQTEIKDSPTVTCLAVFSLGILMGRLMR